MNCGKIRSKLSAYLDNELSKAEKEIIAAHLKTCGACAQELNLLKEQGSFLKQVAPIEVPAGFRARFWGKVRQEEIAPKRSVRDIFVFRWIPVPLTLSVILVFFSVFSVFSPVVYGVSNPEAKKEATTLAAATFTGYSAKSVFAPASFAEFCSQCRDMLCTTCAGNACADCDMKGGQQ